MKLENCRGSSAVGSAANCGLANGFRRAYRELGIVSEQLNSSYLDHLVDQEASKFQ